MLQQGLRGAKSTALRAIIMGSLITGLSACSGDSIFYIPIKNNSSAEDASSSSQADSSSINSVSSSSIAISSSSSSTGPELAPNIINDGNPFDGADFYVNPDIVTAMNDSIARLDPTSDTAQKMETVKRIPSAVWLDRIDAIYGGDANNGRQSLAGHFDAAKAQQLDLAENDVLQPMTAVIAVYNLPDRDCAGASNGTLQSDMDGMKAYKEDYIDVIADTFAQYPSIRIVAVLEPNAYASMLTNLDVAACDNANNQNIYAEGIQYAIAKFANMPNVYTYLDIANSDQLGWGDKRQNVVTGFTSLVKGATPSESLDVIRGFASNTANYAPLEEPLTNASNADTTADVLGENSFVDALYSELKANGFADDLGFIIDTSRNGWGTDGTTDSRVDRTNSCNVKGAGIGELPQATPDSDRLYVDAYYWVKTPGESDGNNQAMCGPDNADALAGAPQAGSWFHEHFMMLVENAKPAIAMTMITDPLTPTDSDADGVADFMDQCPNTEANSSVDAQGCSDAQLVIDNDNDGVDDAVDQCLDTEADATVNAEGCSQAQLFVDTDNDTVNDADDLCLATPADADVNADGCALSQLDSDNDTVTDDKDQCDSTPSGETANEEGCSRTQRDTDNDGVNDALDMCADTAANATVDAQGCSDDQNFVDADEDGVEDGTDQCLSTPANASVNEFGCAASERDTDNDGVNDDADTCANTPVSETANAEGCSNSQTDSDNDNIFDNADQCDNTPAGEVANSQGCSSSQIDTDSDGIFDNADTCANTPANETANAEGCSPSQTDSDNDSIFDNDDQCANTPTGEVANSQGCSSSQVDSDNDSVFDNADTCANTPANETANAQGCSPSQTDSDNDGIFDNTDTCANTPANETADANGCAPSQRDSDNDGINDDADQCSNTPTGETADAQGCSPSQSDSDGDTIDDSADLCPATPTNETANAEGCSASQRDGDDDGVMDNADQCLSTPANASVNGEGCAATERDTDSDTVVDANDQCDNTPTMETANSQGCSPSQLDDDNDGVSNATDQCLTTPANAATNTEGCADSELDSDNDGVSNADDMCAATAPNSMVDGNGCAAVQLDSDNDGSNNAIDQCPNTPAMEAANNQGCSPSQLDDDNDGVMDNADQCLSTPANASVNAEGCAASERDTDNDTVVDANDLCDNTPAGETANAEGCSPSQIGGPSQAETDARIAAGKALYDGASGNGCVGCHGGSGEGSAFRSLTDSTKTYDELVSVLTTGVSFMPACAPVGSCETEIADYIWADFLGKTLPIIEEPAGPSQAETDARLAAGKVLYDGASGNGCVGCHGGSGEGSAFRSLTDSTKTYDELVTVLTTGVSFMPACAPEGGCETEIADYIWGEFLGKALPIVEEPTGPSQAEIDARVAAGKTLYDGASGNGCVGCHGGSGEGSAFRSLTDTTKTYDELVSVLASGVSFMPACAPAGSCETEIADYIWVDFLGKTLTADGGI